MHPISIRVLAAALAAAPGTFAPVALAGGAVSASEEAATAMLRPICADASKRDQVVAKMIAQGGEYEERSAKWDLDVTCEMIDLPDKPVHDTADPADEASHRDWIYRAHWSPGGKSIVTAGRDKSVRIWDVATGKTVTRIDMTTLPAPAKALQNKDALGMVRDARFFDDGRSVIVAADGHPVRIFDAATGTATGEITYQHPDPTWDMPPFIATTAGALVILGGYGGDIVAYDVKAKAERYRLPGAPREYPHIAVSDAAKLLAIVLPGENGHVRAQVLELDTGNPVWSFEAKTALPYKNNAGSIALSRDGKLLGIDVDGFTLVFDVAGTKEIARIPTHPYFGHRHLSFTADGKAIIGGLNHAMMTDIATGKRIRHFGPFSDGFHSADVSPDGNYLVTGHFGSDGRIWEIATGAFHRRLGKDVKPPR